MSLAIDVALTALAAPPLAWTTYLAFLALLSAKIACPRSTRRA